MATARQKKALDIMLENGGVASTAMIQAGYTENTAHTPAKLTESKGFIELCEEKGLTDSLLVNALVEDIEAKKGNRKAELELGFKVRGRMNDNPKEANKTLIVVISGESGARYATHESTS